eukprot:986227_1
MTISHAALMTLYFCQHRNVLWMISNVLVLHNRMRCLYWYLWHRIYEKQLLQRAIQVKIHKIIKLCSSGYISRSIDDTKLLSTHECIMDDKECFCVTESNEVCLCINSYQ